MWLQLAWLAGCLAWKSLRCGTDSSSLEVDPESNHTLTHYMLTHSSLLTTQDQTPPETTTTRNTEEGKKSRPDSSLKNKTSPKPLFSFMRKRGDEKCLEKHSTRCPLSHLYSASWEPMWLQSEFRVPSRSHGSESVFWLCTFLISFRTGGHTVLRCGRTTNELVYKTWTTSEKRCGRTTNQMNWFSDLLILEKNSSTSTFTAESTSRIRVHVCFCDKRLTLTECEKDFLMCLCFPAAAASTVCTEGNSNTNTPAASVEFYRLRMWSDWQTVTEAMTLIQKPQTSFIYFIRK